MVYVTADLHGCEPEVFFKLLERAGFTEEDFLFVLGDVIDRGAHGAQLLLWLTEQPNVQLILGNHEAMLLACDFLFEEVTEESLSKLTAAQMEMLENWFANGGQPTLAGLRRILKRDPQLLEGILEYLADAPLYEDVQVCGKRYILVHAGLGNFHPDKPLWKYTAQELLWERPDIHTEYYPDATVVFGHTPSEYYGEEYRAKVLQTPSWICMDTKTAVAYLPDDHLLDYRLDGTVEDEKMRFPVDMSYELTKKGLLQRMQQSLSFCKNLRPADVGALIERPGATNRRPYGFYRRFFLFCNRPFYLHGTRRLLSPCSIFHNSDKTSRAFLNKAGCSVYLVPTRLSLRLSSSDKSSNTTRL